MLNSKQILEENLLKLEKTNGKPAQIGYDLSLMEINKVGGSIGKVLKDKTISNIHTKINKTQVDGVKGWLLYSGVYDFIMWEGCKIPNNRTAFIKQRSSLMRNGTLIQSSVFDPGFETEHIGSYGFVFETIFIEENARVAQIYFHESTSTNELYNGQWQNDKQRQ
jgi:dUTP pyrophosphatase